MGGGRAVGTPIVCVRGEGGGGGVDGSETDNPKTTDRLSVGREAFGEKILGGALDNLSQVRKMRTSLWLTMDYRQCFA